jgi:hypothetical protein
MSSLFKCEYCASQLKSTSALNYHKKNAKYCLAIQGKEKENKIEFKCYKCSKKLVTKERLETHLLICSNTKSLELEKEIIKLNTIIENYQESEKKYILQIQELQNKLERLANKPTTSYNSNTTNNIHINFESIELNEQLIEEKIDKYNDNYIVDGLQGIASYVANEVLPSENGVHKYLCTDIARNIYKYKNKDNKIVKDFKCNKLTLITQPVMKRELDKKRIDYENLIKDYVETEEEKTKILTGKSKLKYVLDKISETRLEVTDMHKNNKFGNCLATYLTV